MKKKGLVGLIVGVTAGVAAAVAGGLAGALYGPDGIPQAWLDKLKKREWIEAMCERAAKNCSNRN